MIGGVINISWLIFGLQWWLNLSWLWKMRPRPLFALRRVARVCLQLRPLVGVARSELAEVGPRSAGGALRGPAGGSAPTAPPHHRLPQRHPERGASALRSQQPGRLLQTLGGQAPVLRPLHRRHEEDDRLLHRHGGPGAAEQELEQTSTGVPAQMMTLLKRSDRSSWRLWSGDPDWWTTLAQCERTMPCRWARVGQRCWQCVGTCCRRIAWRFELICDSAFLWLAGNKEAFDCTDFQCGTQGGFLFWPSRVFCGFISLL